MSALRAVVLAISLAAGTVAGAAEPVDVSSPAGAGETPLPPPASSGTEGTAEPSPCDVEPTLVPDAPTPGPGWRTVRFPPATTDECLRRFLHDKDFVLVDLGEGGLEVRVLDAPRTARRDPPPARRTVRTDRGAPRVAQAPPAGRKPAPAPPAPLRPREDPARLAWLRGEAIYNPDAAARSQALEQLAASSDHRLILETALEVLERDRDPRVQQGALDALVELPTIPIEPVLRLVNTSPSTRVRVQALELLSDHRGNEQQVRELLRTLARVDRDQHVRRTAQSLLNDLEND